MLTAYTDGGARGNPGPAGFGVQIVDETGAVVAELHESLGHTTNNVAEYRGLIAALAWAVEHRASPLRVRMDSDLIVKQMRGVYKVKHPGLLPLHAEARGLVTRVGRVVFEHVRREQNREADRLSNLAMDLAAGKRPVEEAPAARVSAITRPAPDVAARAVPHTPRRPVEPVHRARPARFEFDADE